MMTFPDLVVVSRVATTWCSGLAQSGAGAVLPKHPRGSCAISAGNWKVRAMVLDDTRFEIGIYFVDTTYGHGDAADWEVRSAALRREIEQEYGVELRDEDIAPGFSFPAWETILAVAGAATTLFFFGDKITPNVKAWVGHFERIKHFLKRPAYLDYSGALVVAMHAVIDECRSSGTTSVQQEGYAIWFSLEGPVEYDMKPLVGFADPPEIRFLGVIVHIFQIAVDERRFKVYVEGTSTHLVEMPHIERETGLSSRGPGPHAHG
jgi:hypothetical protein